MTSLRSRKKKVIYFMDEKMSEFMVDYFPKQYIQNSLEIKCGLWFDSWMVQSWRKQGILAEGYNISILRHIFGGYNI